MSIVDWQLIASDLERQAVEYRGTIAQQAELLAAHKSEMQDWQRELLAAQQQVAALTKERDELEQLYGTEFNANNELIGVRAALKAALGGAREEAEKQYAMVLEGAGLLAASQAREVKLRDAIDKEVPFVRTSDMPLLDAALALPTDDTALQARLKEEREKCAVECEQHGPTIGRIFASKIRSMK